MKTNRRNFLKTAGMAGAGMMAGGLSSCAGNRSPGGAPAAEREHKQIFNMSGFAAPPLKTVRVAVTGTGRR
ncbi:MAG: twin-arginine translocation signal domain-containing protein, partial [Verrucomicrobia bacterium]|nr:twin-arginine translocation signal domain-containing protein [Verrucomicrobiota bacterium]